MKSTQKKLRNTCMGSIFWAMNLASSLFRWLFTHQRVMDMQPFLTIFYEQLEIKYWSPQMIFPEDIADVWPQSSFGSSDQLVFGRHWFEFRLLLQQCHQLIHLWGSDLNFCSSTRKNMVHRLNQPMICKHPTVESEYVFTSPISSLGWREIDSQV